MAKNNILENRERLKQKTLGQTNNMSQEVEGTKPPSSSGNILENVYYTGVDVFETVQEGVSKGLEGIVDFGSLIVGEVGGLFDEDFKEQIKKSIEYDWTKEVMVKKIQPITTKFAMLNPILDEEKKQNSYLKTTGKAGEFIDSAFTSVGQMLPAIGVGAATGGTSLVASSAVFGISAAGSGAEEAFNEGANYEQGFGYGIASGITETAIEAASGGIGGIGKGFIDKAASKVIKSSLIRSAIGEGLEEVVSEYTTPALKLIYKDRYETPSLQQVADSFIVGALAGGIMQGSVKIPALLKFGKNGTKAMEKFTEINEINKLEEKEAINNTLTPEKVDLYKKERADIAEELDVTFKEMDKVKEGKSEQYKEATKELTQKSVDARLLEKGLYQKEVIRLNEEIQKETNIEKKNKLVKSKNVLDNKATAYIKSIPTIERAKVIKDLGLDWKYNEKGILRKTDLVVSKYQTIALPTRAKKSELVKMPISNNIVLDNTDIKEITKSKKEVNKYNRDNNTNYDIVVYEGRTDENSFIEKNVVYLNKNNLTNVKEILKGNVKSLVSNKEDIIAKEDQLKLVSSIEIIKSLNYTIEKNEEIFGNTLGKIKVLGDVGTRPSINKIEDTQIALVNSQAGIENYLVENGITKEQASSITDTARSTKGAINYALKEEITDKKGNVLSEGFAKISDFLNKKFDRNKQRNQHNEYVRKFEDYLLNQHNINRQNIYAKLTNKALKTLNLEEGTNTLLKNKNVKKTSIDVYYNAKLISEKDYNTLNEYFEETKIKKEVFGKFLYLKDLDTILLDKLETNYPNLYNEITLNKSLNEEQVTELVILDVDEGNVKLSKKESNKLIKELDTVLKSISAEDSKKILNNYDKQFPEFKEQAPKWVNYNQALLYKQVEGGLITQELYDDMLDRYPNYVPTNRDMTGGLLVASGGTKGTSLSMQINKAFKNATGSDRLIEPLDIVMARKTAQIYNSIAINKLAREVAVASVKDNGKSGKTFVVDKRTLAKVEDIDYDKHIVEAPQANNTITFYNEGEAFDIKVSENIYKGFYALSNHNIKYGETLMNVPRTVVSTMKRLVTDFNPFFIFRNVVRDFQDAGLYSKYGIKDIVKSFPKVINEMKNNGKYWKEYQANGGTYSTFFDYEVGITENKLKNKKQLALEKVFKPLTKVSHAIQKANFYTEQWIRFAEYRLARTKNVDVSTSLYYAHDITVNFGRSGYLVKYLNSNLMPFLNAQVQGANKLYRTLVSKKSLAQWNVLLVRVALLGIIPSLLNGLMYDDDEDYKALTNYYKDNFYLLKVGGNFIKIPKGRILGIFGGGASRTKRFVVEKDSKAYKDYLQNSWANINPTNDFRTIFSPITDVSTNTTWYGGTIEGTKYNGIRPSKRYNEETSWLSKRLGSVLNQSPLKIDYLLDQYSGIVGDIIIPATSSSTQTNALTFVKKNTVVDSTTNNKYSREFYDYYTKVEYSKNDGDVRNELVFKYMNKVRSSISELYKKDKEIKESTELSAKEKNQQLRLNQIIINNTMKQGLVNSQVLSKTLSNFTLDAYSKDDDYREATRLAFGSEVALSLYNKNIYNKSIAFNKLGFSFDDYYKYYFALKDIKDINNYSSEDDNATKSIRSNTQSYINKLKVSKNLKYLLYLASGNTLDSNQLTITKNYLKKSGLTNEELNTISSKLLTKK